jgi:rubredoxin
MSESRYACPCCGFLTLPEKPPGTFAVCPVCFWEDDDAQFRDPTYAGGANQVSLVEARKNFRDYGAVKHEFREQVRAPLPEETN